MIKRCSLLALVVLFSCSAETETKLHSDIHQAVSKEILSSAKMQLVKDENGIYLPIRSPEKSYRLPINYADGKYSVNVRIGDDCDDSDLGNNAGKLNTIYLDVDANLVFNIRIGDDTDDSDTGNNEGKNLLSIASSDILGNDITLIQSRIGDDDDDSDLGNNSGKSLELFYSPEDPSLLLVRIGDDDDDSNMGNNSGKTLELHVSSNNISFFAVPIGDDDNDSDLGNNSGNH